MSRVTPQPLRPAAVIFDWDETIGTLKVFETSVAVPQIRAYLEGNGHDAQTIEAQCSRYLAMAGGTLTGSNRESIAFAGYSDEERAQIHSILKSPALSTIVPGIAPILTTLRRIGIPCGVASNSLQQRLLRNVSDAQMSGAFDAVVSSEEVGAAKPAPTSIIRAMDIMGIADEDRPSVIYIGNRVHDAEAAAAAGVQPWIVGYGIPEADIPKQHRGILDLPGARYFSSPAQLAETLYTVCKVGQPAPLPERPGL